MLANVKVLAVSAALAVLASAGRVTVKNNCSFDVSVWAVGGVQSPVTHVKPAGAFSEAIRVDAQSGGRDVKITRKPNQLHRPHPHLQLAYSLTLPSGKSPRRTVGSLGYDLNNIYNVTFPDTRITLRSQHDECPPMLWEAGFKPEGMYGQSCEGTRHNLTLTLCAPAGA